MTGALVGRHHERQVIDGLLTAARSGTAGVLVVLGEAGIGKSRLMDEVVNAADGWRVVRATGAEEELSLPFCGLFDLLRSLSPHLANLPASQAEALTGIIETGSPPSGDRFAAAVACLALLADAADETPLLVIVDDAHWLDQASLDVVLFVGRRLVAERLVVIIAARSDTPTVERLRHFKHLELSGLDKDDAMQLLSDVGHHGIGPAEVGDLLAETGGNPLGLLELAGRSGAHVGPEPRTLGDRLTTAFGRRISTLGAPCRTALLILACSGATAPSELAAALRAAELEMVDLEEAEAHGLVTVSSGHVGFTHPLVRSAMYTLASPAERRRAHRWLAVALGRHADPMSIERRCLHLASATEGTDEAVAAMLEEAAEAATRRRSYATALLTFEQAALLSADPERRAGRSLAAAELTQAAGRIERAGPLLEAVAEATTSQGLRAAAEHVRCRIEMWNGEPAAARDRLASLAREVEAGDPGGASYMLAHAALTSVTLGDLHWGLEASNRAVELAAGLPDELRMPVSVVRAGVLAIAGDSSTARTLIDGCRVGLEAWDALGSEQLLLVAALCHLSVEQTVDAGVLLDRAIAAARAAGALGLLPFQLSWSAFHRFHLGDWYRALSDGREAVTTAVETGWRTERPNALAVLALVEAGMGRERECREHAAEAAALASDIGVGVTVVRAERALGLLELGLGRQEHAVVHLQRVRSFAEHHDLGDAVLLTWAGDLAEAHVRAGEPERARELARRLVDEAERTGRPTARAVARRVAGLLAAGSEADECFAAALRCHAEATNPFEAARTRLAFGEHLRRDKRKAEARPLLETALHTFEQLGARPWAERAGAELAASGLAAHRRSEPALEGLTPQELQVAVRVGAGRTNAEAAAELFISAKTVEYHLSRVYRKIGVRSRTELAVALGEQGPSPGRTGG